MFNFGSLYWIMERDKGSRKAVKIDGKKKICSELASAIKKVSNDCTEYSMVSVGGSLVCLQIIEFVNE